MPNLSLDIYLTDGSFACERADRLADDIREWFPQIQVTVHRLGADDALPTGVVALPVFLLDGQVVQYSTPDQGQISEAVVRSVSFPLGSRTDSGHEGRGVVMSRFLPRVGRDRPSIDAAKTRLLAANELFKDLDAESMARVDQMTEITTSPSGQVVFGPENTGDVLLFLKQDRIQSYKLNADGKSWCCTTSSPAPSSARCSRSARGWRTTRRNQPKTV